MTIISEKDNRNEFWASNKSSFGQRMLSKMGWKEGKGLGKNEQGDCNNLRAVRTEEGLGIGAKTDVLGNDGFCKTSENFHGILASLQDQHTDKSTKKKLRKKEKKERKKSKNNGNSSGEDISNDTLTLSKTRVTAGHSQKMRESKNLTTKSKEDLAAIFGMKVDTYQTSSVWGKLSSINTSAPTTNDEEEKKESDDVRVENKDSCTSSASEEKDETCNAGETKSKKKKKKKDEKKKRKRSEKESKSSKSENTKKKRKSE